MTGAEVLVKRLEAHDVEYIFGYSGGAAIPIFDALVTTETPIKLILTRHEQGAAHAADGYARSTGKPGVVLVTSGPGAGNIVTGLMTAHMDSVPLIVISGQQIRAMLGLDAFQEADVFNITMPVVKHNYLVMETDSIPTILDEAFMIATTGRPGPVLLDIPKDVSSAEFTGKIKKVSPRQQTRRDYHDEAVKVAELLSSAKRPVFLAGHGIGIAGAEAVFSEVVQQFDTPVVTTLLGKGSLDERHPLSYGMLGMHGTAYANKAIMEADVIVNIGSRFDDRITGDGVSFGKGAHIVHVDIDGAEIGKSIRPDTAVIADAKDFLTALRKTNRTGSHLEWRTHLNGYKKSLPLHIDHGSVLTQQAILEAINTQANGTAVVTTDCGQHQMWSAQFMQVDKPRNWMNTGGAGTMGFGLPSAIGAQLGRPGELVIAIVGDGGFQMTSYELATAALHKLPIKVFIMNNHYLGMVRQWQELFYDSRLSGVDLEGNPDFVKLAESYGIRALNLDREQDIDMVVAQALAYNDGPIVVNCEVAKTDNVYPMVPAGKGYEHMLVTAPTEKLEKPTGST